MDKYSSYKDSGVQWIGQIPSHWEVKHLRNFLTIFSEKGFDNAQLLSVTREKGVILRDRDDKEENHNYVPDDLSGYKHLMSGDFVINKMKSWQGSYGVSKYEGIVSPAYFTCKLRGVDPQFFSQAIRSKAYIGFFMQYSKGIRVDQWDLDPSSMKDIPFILPPLDEQKKIVPYLDAATAKIDEAIAQQQRMIDLLNERKQIVINNAVTRGVSSCTTYRESGYDWIGVIPSHWEIRKLKYYVTPSREKAYKALPYIGLENIESHTGKFILTDSEYDINQSLLCNKNDVIFGKLRPYLAKAYLCDRNYCCSNEFVVMRDTPVPKFLQYVLLSTYFVNKVDASTYGAKMPRADIDYILNLPIAIPPVNEQGEIVRSVNEQFSIIDKMIAPKAKLLSLLQERKQIIINDVVTGKVKVF